MAFLVYKKSSGKLTQISDVSGAWTAEDTISTVYGPKGNNVFGGIEWDMDFPVGKIVVDGVVVDDPNYVPPAPPVPLEPTPTSPPEGQ